MARDIYKDSNEENKRVAIKVLKKDDGEEESEEEFEAQIFMSLYKR